MARSDAARQTDTTDELRTEEEPAEQFLEWTGDPVTGASAAPFEERVLTRKDLKDTYRVDLPEGTARLVWNAANRHRIPVSELSPEVVEVLTTNETGFRVTDKR